MGQYMKILVIGGTYFLGKAFVNLAGKATSITVLNRGNRKDTFDKALGVKEIIADRHALDEKLFEEEAYDVIVDFCAYNAGDIASVTSMLEGRFKQYIFVSTTDVYRRGTGMVHGEDFVLEERVLPGNAGEYIAGKVALEKEIKECAEKSGFAYTSLRPAFIYGPDNYAPRENIYFKWIDAAAQIISPTDATGKFQMVYVEDVAEAILNACGNEKAYNQAFNICGEKVINYEDFEEALRKATRIDFAKIGLSVKEINTQQIPLPFPLTEEESEICEGKNTALLVKQYTPLSEGLKQAYDCYQERELFRKIDGFFSENKPKEAERFMLDAYAQATDAGKDKLALTLLNELIGYYRQTSEKERLLDIIDKTLALLEKMDAKGNISYATSLLNIATGYRSIAEIENAKKYYKLTEEIYENAIREGTLDKRDLLVAGLYNNLSLMYQELADYKMAQDYLLRALEIVNYHKAEYEIATTYANLANTMLLAKDYEKTYEYAGTAISLFQAQGIKNPHYCAALSAMAGCFFEWGEISRAKKLYEKAKNLVEANIGKNRQYERLSESIRICEEKGEEKTISGRELSKLYYREYGAPMIKEKFGAYENKIAVGLVGEGSECYGYDDALSTDHDFGPEFCMWLDEETYAQIGEELQKAYDNLPTIFRGYQKNTTAMGQGRRGVMTINDFYEKHLHTANYEEIDFKSVPDYELAVCTNGEIFRDDAGIFSTIREKIKKGYPEDIRLIKMAEDVANFSQSGQYNYKRMRDRGDEFTASIMLHDFCKTAMKLYHHYQNAFPPHDKWLKESTLALDGGSEVVDLLERIVSKAENRESTGRITKCIDALATMFANRFYETGEISDIDNYLDHHIEELLCKAGIATLDKKELVTKIARLEFEAFDKVQNEGGRAFCQNDWPTFSVMRKSQYLTWNREMLLQYYYDFLREYKRGHNLITEKYGRMMESTDPTRYEEIKDNFPALSDEKKGIIEKIVSIQMSMAEEMEKEYPKVISNARSLHTYEDTVYNTSYETYLRGEISTYSDKMLQLYGRYVVNAVQSGQNIAYLTMENTAKLYGYQDIEAFEQSIK